MNRNSHISPTYLAMSLLKVKAIGKPFPLRLFPIVIALLTSLSIVGCTSPAAPSPEQLSLGKQVYEQQCMACHGVQGIGQYPNAPNQKDAQGLMGAPPHDSTGHTWHHPDGLLFSITKNGQVAPGFVTMPAFGEKLKDEEIWAVLAYIKTWWTPGQIKIQATTSAQYTPRAIQIK